MGYDPAPRRAVFARAQRPRSFDSEGIGRLKASVENSDESRKMNPLRQ